MRVSALAAQGTYGLVTNLGSFVARFLLQPIEETSSVLFARLAHDKAVSVATANAQVGVVVTMYVKLMTYVGLVVACFGSNFSTTLLGMLYGSRIGGEAGALLSMYCTYVLFMAINGITEGFLHATVNRIGVVNAITFALSLIHYATLYWAVVHFGPAGLIAANCINMALRIVQSLAYIAIYYSKEAPLRAMFPNIPTLFAFGVAYGVTRTSSNLFENPTFLSRGTMLHIFIGLGALVGVAGVAVLTDKQFLSRARQIRAGKLE
eukprot:c19417_g1_i2.p1 GENE.c19417_g1_i2~~c19417_g1_i2.p1  ORF type:complete len:264 (+),score=52.87 c19417_g1_i2:957-1748(+)